MGKRYVDCNAKYSDLCRSADISTKDERMSAQEVMGVRYTPLVPLFLTDVSVKVYT